MIKFKPTTYADERRIKHPSRGHRMDYGNSRSVAIEEFCRQCIEGDASQCPSFSCPLFPFRPGAQREGATQRIPGMHVPTEAEYIEMLEQWRAENPEAMERARQMRAASE